MARPEARLRGAGPLQDRLCRHASARWRLRERQILGGGPRYATPPGHLHYSISLSANMTMESRSYALAYDSSDRKGHIFAIFIYFSFFFKEYERLPDELLMIWDKLVSWPSAELPGILLKYSY